MYCLSNSQLSKELGFPIVANAALTFTKCLEMKLQDHIEVIAKVAEIAGKEYSIEQVNTFDNSKFLKFIDISVSILRLTASINIIVMLKNEWKKYSYDSWFSNKELFVNLDFQPFF